MLHPPGWQAGCPSHLPDHQQEVHAERTEDNRQAALPTAPPPVLRTALTEAEEAHQTMSGTGSWGKQRQEED